MVGTMNEGRGMCLPPIVAIGKVLYFVSRSKFDMSRIQFWKLHWMINVILFIDSIPITPQLPNPIT